MATATRTNEDLIQRVYDALNDQDRDAFAALCTGEFVLHGADEDLRGLDAVIDYQWGTMFEAFPDPEFTVEDSIAEDDRGTTRLTITGTQEGDFKDIPSTGAEFRIAGIHVTRIEDGHAAEAWLDISIGILGTIDIRPV